MRVVRVKMPWKHTPLLFTLGETYELGFPHLTRNRRKRVVLTSFSVQLDGTIRADFVPDVTE